MVFDVLLGIKTIFQTRKMVAELAEDGFKTVVIIDPGKNRQRIFRLQRGFRKDYFAKS
jgi:alpha-glucosidase